ncbi:MAG TPA: endonuclease/exonuclease/phosphatase family protein [Natronosporangium sp.]
MRILTWNLWWRHGPWQQRRAAIAETLAAIGPDVCGLQEVWGDPEENLAAQLADRLGMHWCWASVPVSARHRANHGEHIRIGNAILSRWPIAAQAEHPLPVADGEQPRVAAHARIEAPGGALPFFTTHLTARADASAERVAQVRALAEFVNAHRDGAGYPPVVTGDLNAEPDSDEVRLLSGLNTAPAVPGLVLVDAWRYAESGDPGLTWSRRNPYVRDIAVLEARIDYVLVGIPFDRQRGRVRSVRVAADQPVDGVWPSDHFAVVAEVSD